MFEIQNISSGMKYCICQDSWRYFRIVNLNVEREYLSIFMQNYGEIRRKLIGLPRRCDPPEYLLTTKFEFSPREHVKIEVLGGKIILIGASHVGSWQTTVSNSYRLKCPFSDFDDININKKDEKVKLDEKVKQEYELI